MGFPIVSRWGRQANAPVGADYIAARWGEASVPVDFCVPDFYHLKSANMMMTQSSDNIPGRQPIRVALFAFCAAVLTVLLLRPVGAAPAGLTFTVDSNSDVTDAQPGNGVCDTGGGVCTLRAAVTEANAA